jgi:1,4-dihydroxy-2-naphthoate octaprenyltransferase
MAVRTDAARPGIVSTWLLAARPATLWAAVVPVVVGTAAAQRDGDFRMPVLVLALAVSLLLQIGTNLANDVFDFERGADSGERLGPPRVTQTGLLSPGDVRRGMLATFAAAAAIGLGLTYWGGWPIVVVGALAIIAGIAYTGGPWPTGYHGLGDVFVFCFFGLVAVAGTYYLHTDTLSWPAIVAAIPVGLLITAILVVNNLRDIETDARTGKRTLAVRIGDRATRVEYAALVVGAYVLTIVMAAAWSWWLLLPLVSTPAAMRVAAPVVGGARAGALNVALKRTAQLQLLFGLLLALGFLL